MDGGTCVRMLGGIVDAVVRFQADIVIAWLTFRRTHVYVLDVQDQEEVDGRSVTAHEGKGIQGPHVFTLNKPPVKGTGPGLPLGGGRLSIYDPCKAMLGCCLRHCPCALARLNRLVKLEAQLPLLLSIINCILGLPPAVSVNHGFMLLRHHHGHKVGVGDICMSSLQGHITTKAYLCRVLDE